MYNVGDIINVTVTSIVNYGVFVKTNDNYTGLIHISEINGSYIRNINELFKRKDNLKVKIIGIDQEKKHLSLSMKNIESEKSKKTNSLKEVGEGFNNLKNQLPIWIDDTKNTIEKDK